IYATQLSDKSTLLPYTTLFRSPRIQIVDGLFHASLSLDNIADLISIVSDSRGDGGPAVIFSRFDPIKFISAPRSEFIFPKIPGDRMKRKSLDIPVAIRVYFSTGITSALK